MADVFISYKREERASAKALAEALEAHGFSVWWDVDLLPGEQYRTVILQILDKCRAAIVLWSPESASSHWVLDEASRALARNKLLPIIITPLPDMPLGFGQLHSHKLIDWSGAPDAPAFEPILAGVERLVGRPRTAIEKAAPTPPPAPTPARDEGEVAIWRGVQDTRSLSDLRAYLARYGENGLFADLARSRIAELSPAPAPPPAPPSPPSLPPPTPAPQPLISVEPSLLRLDQHALIAFASVWALTIATMIVMAAIFEDHGDIGEAVHDMLFRGNGFAFIAVVGALTAITLSTRRVVERLKPAWSPWQRTLGGLGPLLAVLTFLVLKDPPHKFSDVAIIFTALGAFGFYCHALAQRARKPA